MDSPTKNDIFYLEPGSLINQRYEVVRTLGAGGMGTVVQVIDRSLENEVIALKILNPSLVSEQVTFARFRNEVLIARQLTHPSIVRTYDFGKTEQGYFYISMEYVEGKSLHRKIYERGGNKLTFDEIISILLHVLEALSYAHKKNVIHRDIKPDNILLSETGEVKVSDFGLARTNSLDKGLTATGETVGTPAYMAPEQIRSEPIDGRVDIYALGVTAYEMVVRRRPFVAEAWFDLATKHLTEPFPTFNEEIEGIPSWYESFILTCTQKNREDRFSSAEEALKVLESHVQNPSKAEVQYERRKPLILSFYTSQTERGKKLYRKLLLSCLFLLSALSFLVFSRYHQGFHNALASILLKAESAVGFYFSPLKKLIGTDLVLNESAWFQHIENNHLNETAVLLEAGMNPNIEDAQGRSALHLVAENSFSDLALLLLSYQANPNVIDRDEMTPLMHSSKRGNTSLVYALLANGAYVNARDKSGSTALIYASISGNVSVLQALLDRGAYVNVRDNNGKSALIHAAERGARAVIQVLLDKNADVNIKDNEGNTSLMMAAKSRDLDLVQPLLQAGADVELTNNEGKNVFNFINKLNDTALYEILAAAKPSVVVSEEDPIPNITPQRELIRKTRLRVKGEPTGVWEFSRTRTLKEITVQVRNDGEEVAKEITVTAKIPDGKEFKLTGPSELKPREIQPYTIQIDEIVFRYGKITVDMKCENCF